MAFLVLPCIGVVDDTTKSFLPEPQEVLNLYRSTIPREHVRYLFYSARAILSYTYTLSPSCKFCRNVNAFTTTSTPPQI